MYTIFRGSKVVYEGFEIDPLDSSDEGILRSVRKADIWQGELPAGFRKIDKPYGFELELNNTVLKFVEPEYVATPEGLPPANVEV